VRRQALQQLSSAHAQLNALPSRLQPHDGWMIAAAAVAKLPWRSWLT
jgi:hypothetical protein